MGAFSRLAQRGLAAIGFFTLSAGITGAYVFKRLKAKRLQLDGALPSDFILELDLDDVSLLEKPEGGLQSLVSQGRPRVELSKAVIALAAAREDYRVKGLLAFVGPLGRGAGLAQVQELRQAVLEFRDKADTRAATVAYADSFGEGGAGGTATYYLASAFEYIYTQPTGLLSFTGLAVQQPFARGLLDKYKLKALILQREEYKSAASFLTGKDFTRAEREATKGLLADIGSQIISDVAANRKLTAEAVRDAVDTAPHTVTKAQALGLLDGALHRDQAVKIVARLYEFKRAQAEAAVAAAVALARAGSTAAAVAQAKRSGGKGPRKAAEAEAARAMLAEPDAEPSQKLERVPLRRYVHAVEVQQAKRQKAAMAQALQDLQEATASSTEAKVASTAPDSSTLVPGGGKGWLQALQPPTVAVLTLAGNIVLGRGDKSPAGSGGGRPQIASLPVQKALEKVRTNPAVKAVVLRIDSPGGSAQASEAIHREISLLRKAGKPVVVSMGNAAASGGYYIACPASKIVAQPATLTGSIGVLSGKVVLNEWLKDSLQVNVGTVKVGKNADAMSPLNGFTKEQEKQANALTDAVYEQFLARVAEGRGMDPKSVRRLARGRVWTGQQALVNGLVDELGGLADAIRLAKQEAGLSLEEGAVLVSNVYPPPPSPLLGLLGLLGPRNGDAAPAASLLETLALALLGVGLEGGPQLAAEAAAAGSGAAAGLEGLQLPEGLQLSMGPQMFSPLTLRVLGGLAR